MKFTLDLAATCNERQCPVYHIGDIVAFMLRWRNHSDTAALALESCAKGAGAAFACAYGSSAEFDAALIAARRAAGVYGPKRHRKRMLISTAAIAAGLLAATLFII